MFGLDDSREVYWWPEPLEQEQLNQLAIGLIKNNPRLEKRHYYFVGQRGRSGIVFELPPPLASYTWNGKGWVDE